MTAFELDPSFLPEPASREREEHRLDGPVAVRSLLKEVAAKRVLLTMFSASRPPVYVATRIESLAENALGLDITTDEHRRSLIAAYPFCTVVGFVDGIKIQFDVPTAGLSLGPSTQTLRTPLPANAYRFQRRDAHRVRPGSQPRLQCFMRDGRGGEDRFAVADISASGVALSWPQSRPTPPLDIPVHHCRIDGEIGAPLACTLTPTHIAEAACPTATRRIGFAITNLSDEAARRLQVLVTEIEVGRLRSV